MSNIENYRTTENVKGVIGAYLHTGEAKFVQVGTELNQGYYEIPENNVVFSKHMQNLIVLQASDFIAKRMRPGTSWGAGITHLEVGTGVGTGTQLAPQEASVGQESLRDPLYRKVIDSWTYIDTNSNPTAVETNRIRLTVIFNEAEAVGDITEMGLFGGSATLTLGTGYMFNFKTFKLISKTSETKLTFTWTLSF